jgi:hypothetical protein
VQPHIGADRKQGSVIVFCVATVLAWVLKEKPVDPFVMCRKPSLAILRKEQYFSKLSYSGTRAVQYYTAKTITTNFQFECLFWQLFKAILCD